MNHLKLFLLSGAAAVLGMGAQAADMPAPIVSQTWDAFVAAGAGYTWFDADDFEFEDDLDDFAAEIRATASYDFSGGFGVQSDVVFNYQAFAPEAFGAPDDIDFSSKNVDAAGHVFYRTDGYLIGVIGQYGFTSFDPILPDVDRFYVGGEAQAYWGNFTLYAQGGYQEQSVSAIPDSDFDGFFVKGEARYFAGDNFKLSVRGGYSRLSLEEDDDFELNTFTVGGGAEYRFADNPISVFVNADYSDAEIEEIDLEYSDVRVMAGLKLNLGTQTLLERDRSGATLDPVKPGTLPAIFSFGPP
jgi:opacity protein-like surface antigen